MVQHRKRTELYNEKRDIRKNIAEQHKNRTELSKKTFRKDFPPFRKGFPASILEVIAYFWVGIMF